MNLMSLDITLFFCKKGLGENTWDSSNSLIKIYLLNPKGFRDPHQKQMPELGGPKAYLDLDEIWLAKGDEI